MTPDEAFLATAFGLAMLLAGLFLGALVGAVFL